MHLYFPLSANHFHGSSHCELNKALSSIRHSGHAYLISNILCSRELKDTWAGYHCSIQAKLKT